MVSIAGPYRKGKSYVLSEAFEQSEVFPLGHHFDPETMGIWMWVVPQKIRVRFGNCQLYNVQDRTELSKNGNDRSVNTAI